MLLVLWWCVFNVHGLPMLLLVCGVLAILQVSCGSFFTAVLVAGPTNVEAWMFGSNKHGELGYGAGGQDCALPVS